MKLRTTIIMEDNEEFDEEDLTAEYLRQINELWDVTMASLTAESPGATFRHEGTVIIEDDEEGK